MLGVVVSGGCATSPQIVQVPVPSVPSSVAFPPGTVLHRVQRGETLWSIGKTYGVSHQDILRTNRLSHASQLPAGQVLVIPPIPSVQPVVPIYPNTRWTHIVIHHTATETGNAKMIDRSHRKRGFAKGMGYHFLINNGTVGRRDGQIEIGRRWTKQLEGAHCNAGGMNHHGIGICLVGDFTTHPPSAAQIAALAALVQQLRASYQIPVSRVIHHRDVAGKNTECPGDQFPWAEFRAQIFSGPSS